MSVYIKGMEMPKEHPLYITFRPDGSIHVWDSYNSYGYGTQAVPVPEHGDLIEKHDVFKLISAFPSVDKLLTVDFMQALYNLPTIIPADKEKQT